MGSVLMIPATGGSLSYQIPNEAANASFVGAWAPESGFATALHLQSASASFDGSNAIVFLLSLSTGESMLLTTSYLSDKVTAVIDTAELALLSDSGTGMYISKSASSSVVTIKNRMGGARQIGILAINSKLSGVSAWA